MLPLSECRCQQYKLRIPIKLQQLSGKPVPVMVTDTPELLQALVD
jgi:hypothetical protein